MSAFGQAGFGSMNRRNQLRAQGQMGDPYGQQVRSSMQAPTFNIYNSQQATAQKPATQQPAQQSAPASQPNMQAYSTPSASPTPPPQSPSLNLDPSAAQPIQPQSQGTPYPPTSNEAQSAYYLNRPGMEGWGDLYRGAGAPRYTLSQSPQGQTSAQASTSYAQPSPSAGAAATSGEPTSQGQTPQHYIDQIRRQVIDWGEVPFGMNPFAFRQNLMAGKIDISGQPVTDKTPAWARYDYKAPPPASRQSVGGASGSAQPIPPQSQGTPYQSQAMVNDRPMRSIEDDMAADQAFERQNGWWAQEAALRGVDSRTGQPLANRTAEQQQYANFLQSPPTSQQLPPQWGPPSPQQTGQPSQQLYRTSMNAGVPDQQLAFEQDAFRGMAQRAVDRQAFHGDSDPYVQQFVNRMQYQGFDPRQGLTVSQHIQDGLATRQRNEAIRANPLAYLRGEI
jgi:hypothetical protein